MRIDNLIPNKLAKKTDDQNYVLFKHGMDKKYRTTIVNLFYVSLFFFVQILLDLDGLF